MKESLTPRLTNSERKWLSNPSFLFMPILFVFSRVVLAGEVVPAQEDQYRSCGLNCLTLIARLHEIATPFESIRKLLKPRPNGDCSVADIERAATSLGLRPVSVQAEWSRLPDLPTPCIVQVRSPTRYATGSHFLVLMGLHRDGIILVDPPTQGGMHPYDEFRNDWTGVATFFARDEADQARLVARWDASTSISAPIAATVALAVAVGSWLWLGRAGRMNRSTRSGGPPDSEPTVS